MNPSAPEPGALEEAIAETLEGSKGMPVRHIVTKLARQGVSTDEAAVSRLLRASPRFRLLTPLGGDWLLTPGTSAQPPPPGDFRDELPPLYRWQQEALSAWSAGAHRGVIEAITGAGKTMIGIAAVRAAAGSGMRSLILVPSTPLIGQWERSLRAHLPGIRIARLGGGGTDHGAALAEVTVATVQSAVTRVPAPDVAARMLLVADEAHRYGAPSFRAVLDAGFTWRLGLTATLQRRDGADASVLLPRLGPVVHRLSYAEALEEGVVAPFDVHLVGVTIGAEDRDRYALLTARMDAIIAELKGILPSSDDDGRPTDGAIRSLAGRGGAGSTLAAEYVRLLDAAGDLLDEAPEKMSALRGLAPRIGDSNGCIIFTQTVALARSAARALRDEGVMLSVLTAEQSHEERSATLSRFSAGMVNAIVAPRLLDEGIDVPDADLGIVVSASRSRRQMVQRMGRVIRTKPGGGRATFVVMYGRETREDPANGAHAAFLDEVLPLAQNVQTTED